MRVLMLCESIDGKNGWSAYARQLVDAMRREGHDVRTCTAHADTQGVRLVRASQMISRPWNAWLLARAITRLCRTWNPDIIHITVEPYALIGAFLRHSLAQKTVWTAHGSYGVRLLLDLRTRLLAKRSYARLRQCIAVSAYTKEAVARTVVRFGGRAPHTAVIHNAVLLPSPVQTSPKRDGHTVLCVGGVKPRKGILEALDACRVYRERYGDTIRFVVVGALDEEDSYVRAVRERIRAHGLTERVLLTGMLADAELDRLYADADLFLMPAKTTETTFEGFGIVYLEANARGIPVIGPKESGAAEAIAEGKSGYHVDPGDAHIIAERMHDILERHTLRHEDCVAWAREHSVETQWQAVKDVYASMMPSTLSR